MMMIIRKKKKRLQKVGMKAKRPKTQQQLYLQIQIKKMIL